MTCVAVLEQIRLVVSNRNVPDFPCIEEILLILEILGRGGGSTTILDIHREIRVFDPFP